MSVEQLESAIKALSLEERRKFVAWFEMHRDELVGDAGETSPDVRAELELRLKEMDEHPELLEPFEEEDLDRMFEEFAHARTKKTSARKG
jgi:hypothetical protein